MFWKILFWIFFISFWIFNAIGSYNLAPQGFLSDYTPIQIINSTVLIIWILFTIAYYWALGFGKKIFPKWFSISMLVISLLCYILSFLSGLTSLVYNYMNGINQYSAIGFWYSIGQIFLFGTALYIPFVVPIIVYLIKYKNLENIKEPFYKIFGIYILASMLNNFLFFFGHLNLVNKFNFWDYSVIFITTIFEITVVFCYIFEKKVFTKSIWQTLTYIYIPFVIFAHFLTSITLKTYTNFGSFTYLINMGISYYVIIRALINYAFGDKIFKEELKIEEKNE